MSFNPSEPRDEKGRWTSGGGSDPRSAPRRLRPLRSLSGQHETSLLHEHGVLVRRGGSRRWRDQNPYGLTAGEDVARLAVKASDAAHAAVFTCLNDANAAFSAFVRQTRANPSVLKALEAIRGLDQKALAALKAAAREALGPLVDKPLSALSPVDLQRLQKTILSQVDWRPGQTLLRTHTPDGRVHEREAHVRENGEVVESHPPMTPTARKPVGDGTPAKNIGKNPDGSYITGDDTRGRATNAHHEISTSTYGSARDRALPPKTLHAGVDISPRNSDGTVDKKAAVLSVSDGVVVKAGPAKGFGPNTVVIRTDKGNYLTYGHMSAMSVKPGDRVAVGQKIGIVGTLGRSSGVHLHLQEADGGPFTRSPGFRHYVDPGSH